MELTYSFQKHISGNEILSTYSKVRYFYDMGLLSETLLSSFRREVEDKLGKTIEELLEEEVG